MLRFVTMATMLGLAMASVAALPAETAGNPPGALTAEQLARCETLDAHFGRTGQILKMYRAYKGANGRSKIETIALKGERGVYYGGKVSLTQFGLGDPTKAVIVYGHPNMAIPVHPSPYREIFLILSGSSIVKLPDGKSYTLTPGSMLLSEDQETTGRAGASGPCGYVAIDFQFKPALPQ